jgi:hypothetical protein
MKAFIAGTGPLTACFTVYEDFYYYTGGVYVHTSGSSVGGHCISIVGYNDEGQYWIAKNSWGTGWGEQGFFQIGYGQCGIDSEMWAINSAVLSEVYPMPERAPGLAAFGSNLSPSTPFNQVQITITTGSDDLRGDSEADVTFHFSDGSQQKQILKAQNAPDWENNSVHRVTLSLDPPKPLSAFSFLTITLVQHPGFLETDDNWNIQTLAVVASIFGTNSVAVLNRSGNPLVRLTGTVASQSWAFAPTPPPEAVALYAAWKGVPGDDRLFYSPFNGSTWAAQALVPGSSSTGASLAVFNGSLYAAWKGEGGDQRLWFSSFNGSAWAPQREMTGFSSVGPSLAVFNGDLYAAWKGEYLDQRIWLASFDGSAWSGQTQLPGVGTSMGPSLAVFNNMLYAAWKGQWTDERLWFSSYRGSTWAPQQVIPGASSMGPSLAVFNGRLYAAWKGESTDQRLWYSYYNGSSWAPQQLIPGFSSIGPSLAVFNGTLYAIWKGEGADVRLWYSSFNGSSWSAQSLIPGVGSGPDHP